MTKQKLLIMLAGLVLLIGIFTGCQNQQSKNDEMASEKPKVKIEEINWKVEEGIIEGNRRLLLNITNQSKYTLTNFELSFTEKEGITEEERNGFYDDLLTLHTSVFGSADEEDLEDLNQLKNRPIAMHVSCEKTLEPGDQDCSCPCYYYMGYVYVVNIDHYALVQPDIAHFEYLRDDHLYSFYYDYKTKTYTADGDPEEAYPWTESTLGQMISKPDGKIIEINSDSDNYFSFEIRNCAQSDFETYVQDCKTKGFTSDSYKSEDYFYADNESGYHLSVHYYEDDRYISVSLSSPN